MATWHQMKVKVKLYHDKQWTVVDDPPNNTRSLMLFATKESATDYVERRKALGTGQNCYVLPPYAS